MFRSRAFLRLWTGTTASGIATWALPFILGLAVLERSITAVELGVVLAARSAGFLVAVPVAGVLADRRSRRRVVLWAGLVAGFASPVITVGMGYSVVLMAAAAAVVGAGQGACRPAFQALTAEVVAEGQRQQANAALTLAVRVTTLVAPGLTALLAVVVDTPALVVATGVLWLGAALIPPAGPRQAPAVPGATTRFTADFLDGVREARRHPWFLAGLGALTAVIATGYAATGVVLPVVSRDRYGTEAVLAAALTAYTVGALVGAVVIARWKPGAPGWAALAGLACYGFAPLSLLLPVPAAVVVAAYALAGLGIELFNVPWFTATQKEVDPTMLARVSSLDFLLSYGLAPVGLAVIAPAIDHFGPGPVLAACAAVCFAAPAAAALVPSARGFRVAR
ncbi:MFS transporter [Actinokineospora sp. PR83]|uniref:MFS transporter n=1 Tax=Actinokineospora sp. PR83 TaxID=2884908 RepID=UPI0027DF2079|nr:MFS transporter [Actinokineospora sp. PR83]MCG8918556.1 MFS transporter [Actinokineospora sp. PR83]